MKAPEQHLLLAALILSVLNCCFASFLPLHMASLRPTSGPLTGSTQVTVLGSGFSTSSTLCQFGNVLSPSAVVVNSSVLVCHSPVWNSVGFVPVKVSTDTGVTFTDHSLDFQYFGAIVLSSLAPTQGSILGGRPQQRHAITHFSRLLSHDAQVLTSLYLARRFCRRPLPFVSLTIRKFRSRTYPTFK